MRPRFPLATQILLLAILNVAVLSALAYVLVRWQLGQEFESFLLTAARDRIIAVSRQISLDLEATAPPDRDALLAEYSQTHGVTFLVIDDDGRQMAGPAIPIPPEVRERLRGTRIGGSPRSGPSRRRFVPPFLATARDARLPNWVGIGILYRDPQQPMRLSRGTLLIASPTLLTNRFFLDLNPLLTIAAIAVGVSFLCWLPLVWSITHAVRQMMTATASIAEGDFEVRLASTRPDELGLLSRSIDRMAARLETYVRGQKRFLGDIAHELRSPLGRMQIALGILERRCEEDASAGAYVQDIHEEVELMSGLTDELLTFAKAELRTEPLPVEPVNISSIVERSIRIEVPAEDVEIHTGIDPSLHAMANAEYLFRALSNVLRNAVRYAASDGPITIAAERHGDQVEIRIADSGPGIAEQDLTRIFEPFFRPEASRDRRKGGTGLGLAIVRTCVEACHGTVSCHNRTPSGLQVVITLPAA